MSTKPNALAVFLRVLVLTTCVTAQTAGASGSANSGIAAFTNIKVPMRDGVRIATNVCHPAQNGKAVEGECDPGAHAELFKATMPITRTTNPNTGEPLIHNRRFAIAVNTIYHDDLQTPADRASNRSGGIEAITGRPEVNCRCQPLTGRWGLLVVDSTQVITRLNRDCVAPEKAREYRRM